MRVLEIANLTRSYRAPDGGTSTIVDVPAFSLDAGQHVALAGASGSGKTTFLNLIAGILTADGGSIAVCGQQLCGAAESRRDAVRAMHIGYIFQTFNLLGGYTAVENVLLGMMFGRGADQRRAEALLARVGLADRLHYRPRQLSVGQQQRVAVARALASGPALVLADEPTGNLDARHARAALELIRETCRESGAALLLVSHDREILSTFDDVRDLGEINRAAQSVAPPASAGGRA